MSLAVLQTLTGPILLRSGCVADIPERFSGSRFNRPTRNRTVFFRNKCVYPELLKKAHVVGWFFSSSGLQQYYTILQTHFAPSCKACSFKAIFCIFLHASIILCYSFPIKMKLFSEGWGVWKWTFEFAYVGTDSSLVPGSALCCGEGICSWPVLPPRQAMLAGENAWARCPGKELIHSFPLAASVNGAPPG